MNVSGLSLIAAAATAALPLATRAQQPAMLYRPWNRF
jgi:hypothetical protein